MDDTIAQKEMLLQQLELLADRTDSDSKNRKREVWARLLPMFNKNDERDALRFLSTELQLQSITVKRWVSGEFNPRQTHLLRIRSLLGLTQRVSNHISASPGEGPDPPVTFDNGFAAIRTLNHFFYCLKLSRLSFSFKGRLAYHAGRPGATRETVISLLEKRVRSGDPLIMYYFFVRPSPAEETLARFLNSPRVVSSGVWEQKLIRSFAIQSDKAEDTLGLAHSPMSPLILIYDEQGRKVFDRFLDVFFEIPVEFVQRDNRPLNEEYSLKTVFVQQPEPEALRFWQEVVEFLRHVKGDDPERFRLLEEDHLKMPILNMGPNS